MFIKNVKAVIIASFIMPASEISLKGIPYPTYAKVIGWLIVAVPLSAIPICALIQAYKYRKEPVRVFFCWVFSDVKNWIFKFLF